MEGESGRNELLRGPFALFGVRSGAMQISTVRINYNKSELIQKYCLYINEIHTIIYKKKIFGERIHACNSRKRQEAAFKDNRR